MMRHALAWAAGLLLAAACHHAAPESEPATTRAAALAGRPPGAILSRDHDGDLYFDERYLDSTDFEPEASWSARTRREMAISTQLQRLRLAKRGVADAGAAAGKDSVWEQIGNGPLTGYRNETTAFANIYRKIDSLKVLEHLPITPH